MFTRELSPTEWPAFFDAFSREHQGHAATLDLPEPHTLGTIETIARDLPLVGITAEPARGNARAKSIEIALGTAPEDHLVHTINLPTHVYVGEDDDGVDEVIVIHAERDPTVRLDLGGRPASVTAAAASRAKSARA